ncbi:hypothetical protein ACTHAM_000573 [Cellulomonas soli]|uniref:hypothetical protein n=1 Tax=Cellulomonas soli TaxID=931535 RepID=UPI003F85C14C
MAAQTRTLRAPRDPAARRGPGRRDGAGARVAAASTLVVAALLLAGCTGPGGDQDAPSGGTSTGGSVASPDTASSTTGSGTGSDSGSGSDPGSPDAETDTETSNPKFPGHSAPATLPGLDGVRTTSAATLTGALPATASARGGLVTGFPEQVLPAGTSLDIVSSSVSAEGARLQIGLEAGTGAGADDVRAAFTATLEALGFTAEASPALPGDAATAFVHGDEGLVLTTRERTGGGTELSVAGTLETTP